MKLSRRDTLALGGAVATISLLPLRASATTEAATASLKEFTGGADWAEGGVELTAPEIAENGNTVPIAVSAPGAVAIAIVADGNPNPGVAEYAFGELAEPMVATRMRLSGTQGIIAVAKMADGSFKSASRAVKVTIGGCGG